MQAFFRIIFLLLPLVSWSWNPLNAQLFNPKVFKLKNGLTVAIIENSRAPFVKAMVWYKVGTADDPEGKTGLAHFLEHMMFKGTPRFPGNFYMEEISRLGGLTNAMTSRDFTAYYAIVYKNDLNKVLEMEADRMQNLTLPPEEVIPERKVVLEERRMRFDNKPSALLQEAFARALYQAHPYGRPIIGWYEDIEKLNREDLYAFYKKYYHPNNAVLILVGDVDGEKILPFIEATFGSIPMGKPIVRHRINEPKKRGIDLQLNLASERIERPFFYVAFSAPHFQTQPRDVFALMLLNDYLFNEGSNSLFYEDLVEKRQIATGISAFFDNISVDPTLVTVSVQPTPQTKIHDLEKTFFEDLVHSYPLEITEENLQKIKDRLLISLKYLTDNALNGGEIIGEALTVGYPLDYIEDIERYIGEITREDLQRVYKDVYLAPPPRTGVFSSGSPAPNP